MDLHELIQKKNSVIVKLEQAKAAVASLGHEAAVLEGLIAEHYLSNGEQEKAVVNLISQASCYVDAVRPVEAVSVYRKAYQLTSREEVRQLIDVELEELRRYDFVVLAGLLAGLPGSGG